ncbi:amidohydrolase family protein [Pantoea cypripedii]|uniref:Amidohydrolase n=1 Tax=Pantoea cypripedii TaxID=55209 RepID=A0A1X1EKL8_PANCY|nr:amidohydrolase family protein [Pantoea cypripedii]MBP2199017.1 putative TIM-barrel fold metal-dependent hydrolase [Pantoea cypripedii]ORM89436.1 amidohydrolase [Pantoea cypripedii]
MKIICLEEHTLDKELGMATISAAIAQAPFLTHWGRAVSDGNNPDRSRPQIEKNDLINVKGVDIGQRRLQDMDDAGISMQILSVGGFPQLAPENDAINLNRAANDRLAEAVTLNPSRFAAFATLPWTQPDAAEEELERAVKNLGFKGALLNGRPSENFLDHPDFDNLLCLFNRLNVPLYLHPGLPVQTVQKAYYSGFSDEVSARLSMFGWGWHHEAGIHLLRLILSGAFDRYPNLQVISGHWGEMLPFWLQRLDDSIPLAASGLRRSITQTFQEQVYVTPSGMLTLPHFRFIYELMGAKRILFSADYPYQTLDGVMDFIQCLPVSEEEKELIAFRNAEQLLGVKA